MPVPVQVVGLVPCGLLTCTSYSRGFWLRFVPTEFTGPDLLTLRWSSWTGSFKVYWLWPPILDVADLGLKIFFFNGQGTLSVESVFTSFFTHFLSRVSNYLEPVRKFIGIEFIFQKILINFAWLHQNKIAFNRNLLPWHIIKISFWIKYLMILLT